MPAGVAGRWLHSREEDTASAEVYRREDHPFPPARRPRHGLEFRADGTFVELRPGPDDRPREAAGRWEDAGAGVLRAAFPDGRLRVLSWSGDRLLLARARAPSDDPDLPPSEPGAPGEPGAGGPEPGEEAT
ncbi:hypothetical protein [Spirillospora sp. NPDC029432]|uniref:hypothetical protein n=1 Tax=Spirillospora sp. NPDC029432 TaxID=3154599 RepID=UPI003456F8AC